MVANLQERLSYANDKELSYQELLELLELLCEDEFNN